MNKVSIYSLDLTNEQMMKILGVSYITLTRWRKRGLPHFNEGTSIRYKLADVEKWLEDQGASVKTSFK